MRNDMRQFELTQGYFPLSEHYAGLEGRSWKDVQEAGELSWSLWPPVKWNPSKFMPTGHKQPPDKEHWLGTDDQGRDVFSRIIHGCVVAVMVGVFAMGLAAFIGMTLGLTAGFFRGKVDLVLSRCVEIVMVFPTFFLIIAVISFLEKSIINIMIVIGLFGWTGIYRLVRGEVLKSGAQDYVVAAKALGIPKRSIMFRHVLPNSVAPMFVSVAFGIAGAVLTEASLSFLGFGDTSVPSWGEIVKQGREYVSIGLDYLVIWPGLAIFVTLTAFNLFGQGLRDAMDPRLRH
jgi:peptide/nickel transport system permease protein